MTTKIKGQQGAITISTLSVDTIVPSTVNNVILEKTEYPTLYNFSGTIVFDTIHSNGQWYGPLYSVGAQRYQGISSVEPLNSETIPGSTQPWASTWCNDTELFNIIAGVQYWRVPKTGLYTITANGAGKATTHDGFGISLTTQFILYAGEWLRIVCGAKGKTNGGVYSGGHGASTASVNRNGLVIPILVAGGGAGLSQNSPQSTNNNRNATAPGVNLKYSGQGGSGSFYNTGYDTAIGYYWPAGGGGGWATPGGSGLIGNWTGPMTQGGAPLSSNCPHGGKFETDGSTYWGGFGGGGATGRDGGAAGGGGGWYGGNSTFKLTGSTSDDTTILGGGSYCVNSTFTNNGTWGNIGQVIITL